MMKNIINHIKHILESDKYIVRVQQYNHQYDMVACKNKESYLIKILIGDEGDGYSELVNLANTNGVIPLVIQYDTSNNRISSVKNVLNSQYVSFG